MTKRSALALLSFVTVVGTVGCSPHKPADNQPLGSVSFSLTTMGASGANYRLRSASFAITGPESKTLTSPVDPTDPQTQITSPLIPGAYQIALADGWKMWRIPTTGAPAEVDATLISTKTLSFSIVSSQDQKVVFQFDVAGEPTLPGTVTIGIGVTEVDAANGPADAGATPDVGATAHCGNSAVESGEQCDSAAAFANHTCDQTTCQTIPTVCGNHLVQPGEQCDDGPTGSVTCTTTCTTVGAASTCSACEVAGSTAHGVTPAVCGGTKVGMSSPVGCDGLASAADQVKCRTLLICLQTHPTCSGAPAIDDPTNCFCGTLSLGACSGAAAATIAGQCAAAYFDVYGGVTNANRDNILSDFFARNTATGMANNLYACDVDNSCLSQCP